MGHVRLGGIPVRDSPILAVVRVVSADASPSQTAQLSSSARKGCETLGGFPSLFPAFKNRCICDRSREICLTNWEYSRWPDLLRVDAAPLEASHFAGWVYERVNVSELRGVIRIRRHSTLKERTRALLLPCSAPAGSGAPAADPLFDPLPTAPCRNPRSPCPHSSRSPARLLW